MISCRGASSPARDRSLEVEQESPIRRHVVRFTRSGRNLQDGGWLSRDEGRSRLDWHRHEHAGRRPPATPNGKEQLAPIRAPTAVRSRRQSRSSTAPDRPRGTAARTLRLAPIRPTGTPASGRRAKWPGPPPSEVVLSNGRVSTGGPIVAIEMSSPVLSPRVSSTIRVPSTRKGSGVPQPVHLEQRLRCGPSIGSLAEDLTAAVVTDALAVGGPHRGRGPARLRQTGQCAPGDVPRPDL